MKQWYFQLLLQWLLLWNLLLTVTAWTTTSSITIHHAGAPSIDKRGRRIHCPTTTLLYSSVQKEDYDNDSSLSYAHSNNNNNPKRQQQRRLLIVGYGRVGQEVARLAAKQQATVMDDDDDDDDDESSTSSFFWNQIVGTVRNNNDDDSATTTITSMEEEEEDAGCAITCIPISKLQEELLLHSDAAANDYYYSHVLIAMPPVTEIYQTILDAAVAVGSSKTIQWLGMVSTTGVYGNHNGNWVTEESELRFDRKEEESSLSSSRSQYVQWETAFQRACGDDCKVRIFRCAGIYDSTRSALHTVWKKPPVSGGDQKPATNRKKEEFKTNRIHVADIAQAIVNSMMDEDASTFEIYNLADDLPERRSKVLEYASTLLTRRLGNDDWKTNNNSRGGDDSRKKKKSANASNATTNPAKDDTTMVANDNTTNTTKKEETTTTKSTRRRRRQQEPKLIDNQKLKRTLLPKLQYPTYQQGLDAILVDPQAPWNRMKK